MFLTLQRQELKSNFNRYPFQEIINGNLIQSLQFNVRIMYNRYKCTSFSLYETQPNNFTRRFVRPCIVSNPYNKTNEMH